MGTAAKGSGKKEARARILVRVRVRCANDSHKDPWLRRLYVLWACPPPPVDVGPPAPPVFHLAQSDAKGYLSPVANPLDPDPLKSVPIAPDMDYYYYFVRHPGSDKPLQLIEALRRGVDTGKKACGGDWKPLKAKLEPTGRNKVKEAVLRIPEDPEWFTPKGSDLYHGWVLFRDMPGTGDNREPKHIQCAPLQKEVRRLQYHLGRLRYPVGNQWQPYSPAKWEEKRFPLGRLVPLYPNEGVFDATTWNALLAFQRDAATGSAKQLDPEKPRQETIDAASGDPLPAAEDVPLQIRESSRFLTTKLADGSVAQAHCPHETVVDKTTGDAIRRWLDGGLRKPKKALIAVSTYDSWMCEDVFPVIQQLDARLKQFGFPQGAQFNSTLRDTRMSVVVPLRGQKRTSLHKSGYAFDVRMDGYVRPAADYPLYYVRDDSEPHRVLWIVYAEVEDARIPPSPHPEYVQYVKSIRPWKYDPTSGTGGGPDAPRASDGRSFLNFTKIAQSCGLRRIGAHSDWAATLPEVAVIGDAGGFQRFLKRLRMHVKREDSIAVCPPPPPPDPTRKPGAPVVPPEEPRYFTGKQLADLHGFLSLWSRQAAALGPTPDVAFDANSKSGARFVRSLQQKPFEGRKAWLKPEEGKGAEFELGPGARLPKTGKFVAGPMTGPVRLEPGVEFEFPLIEGTKEGLEWWHFQWNDGLSGKTWGEILADIGWTSDGLLGRRDRNDQGIYGLYGIGYLPPDLAEDAS